MADGETIPTSGTALDSEDVVTVASLNEEIEGVIDDHPDLQYEYVVGDVSDCTESNSHVHFDLVLGDASVTCVLSGFRQTGTTVESEQEMYLAVRGDLSYYEECGSCSLLVTSLQRWLVLVRVPSYADPRRY